MSRMIVHCIGARCYFYKQSISSGFIAGWDAHVQGNRCKKQGLSLKYMARKGLTCPLKQDVWAKEHSSKENKLNKEIN